MDTKSIQPSQPASACPSFPLGEFLGAFVVDLVSIVKIAIDRHTPETHRIVDEFEHESRRSGCPVTNPRHRQALELQEPGYTP